MPGEVLAHLGVTLALLLLAEPGALLTVASTIVTRRKSTPRSPSTELILGEHPIGERLRSTRWGKLKIVVS